MDQECGADPALLAEVEELLSSDSSEAGAKSAPLTPGAMIAGRYRIVTLLGKGGMGEVFLADDILLGQQVALKFLSEHIEAREGGVERFLEEVRTARKVGHPNVARVHDVGEADGRRFLTMEYVDGEDLAQLLKRIGRLPREKAEDIAQQLCAGLDAIHSAGILHRDLKPGNVMLDGDGKVRITDFGLAASTLAIEESQEVAGTLIYMAPEQLEGRPAGERSEIFSLGLLLYEVFTGRRAFRGRTYLELRSEYADQRPTSPSSVVMDLDPTVEEVLLACLRTDPQERPASARALARCLPGGDPLAAAIAAGKTPAPMVVADAADTSGMSPRLALACLVGFLVSVIAAVWLNQRVWTSMPPYAPEVLVKEARDFLETIGDESPRYDSIHSFSPAFDEVVRSSEAHGETEGEPELPERTRTFWYRQSPTELIEWYQFTVNPRWSDPPHVVPGMVRMRMTTRGDLRIFSRVPPAYLDVGSGAAPDWEPFFEAAGIADLSRQAVEARWSHDVHSDALYAWELDGDETRDALRVEAAAAGGEPVAFRVMRRDREPPKAPSPRQTGVVDLIGWILIMIFVGKTILAVRNWKTGRCDRRGALRIAVFMFVVMLLAWLGTANHTSNINVEFSLFNRRLATGLFFAVDTAIGYLAIEPYFRRFWPRLLVSWIRVLDGRWRDRLVGRDILLGAATAGVLDTLFSALVLISRHADPDFLGFRLSRFSALLGLSAPSYLISEVLGYSQDSVGMAINTASLLVVLRLVLRKNRLAVWGLSAWVLLIASQMFHFGWLESVGVVLATALYLNLFLRAGILGLVAYQFVSFLLTDGLITLDTDSWYFGRSSLVLLLVVLVGAWGFRVVTRGRPMFGDPS